MNFRQFVLLIEPPPQIDIESSFEEMLHGPFDLDKVPYLNEGIMQTIQQMQNEGLLVPSVEQMRELELFDPLRNANDYYALLVACFFIWHRPDNLHVSVRSELNSAAIILHYVLRKLEFRLRLENPESEEMAMLRPALRVFQGHSDSIFNRYKSGARMLAKTGLMTSQRNGRYNSEFLESLTFDDVIMYFNDFEHTMATFARQPTGG